MNKQEHEALRLCVASLDQLLPYLAKVPADVGLLNEALVAARPLLKVEPIELAPAQTEQQPEQSEELAWKVLQAATDALDRRAAPHAWISQAWNAGAEVITSRRTLLRR